VQKLKFKIMERKKIKNLINKKTLILHFALYILNLISGEEIFHE